MVITYHGQAYFKVSFGDTTLAFNPISKASAHKTVRFGADIVLISLNDPDFNGIEQVTHGENIPLVIAGPGEYEAQKVFIKGFGTETTHKKAQKINTVYSVLLEGMNICFLGALGNKKLSPETKEALDDIDILFMPIGGGDVLNASDAAELSTLLEPAIIIPMLYGGESESKNKAALKTFLKEEGAEGVRPVDKLTIKQKDVSDKEGEVVVLES